MQQKKEIVKEKRKKNKTKIIKERKRNNSGLILVYLLGREGGGEGVEWLEICRGMVKPFIVFETSKKITLTLILL